MKEAKHIYGYDLEVFMGGNYAGTATYQIEWETIPSSLDILRCVYDNLNNFSFYKEQNNNAIVNLVDSPTGGYGYLYAPSIWLCSNEEQRKNHTGARITVKNIHRLD